MKQHSSNNSGIRRAAVSWLSPEDWISEEVILARKIHDCLLDTGFWRNYQWMLPFDIMTRKMKRSSHFEGRVEEAKATIPWEDYLKPKRKEKHEHSHAHPWQQPFQRSSRKIKPDRTIRYSQNMVFWDSPLSEWITDWPGNHEIIVISALQEDQLNVQVIHIILQDPVVEPRNPIQLISVSNFYSRAYAWKDTAAAASSPLPLPSHYHKPETIPGMTTAGSYINNLSVRFPNTCTLL